MSIFLAEQLCEKEREQRTLEKQELASLAN